MDFLNGITENYFDGMFHFYVYSDVEDLQPLVKPLKKVGVMGAVDSSVNEQNVTVILDRFVVVIDFSVVTIHEIADVDF